MKRNAYRIRQAKQEAERRRERTKLSRISTALSKIIDSAFRAREKKNAYDFRPWGDRAIDCMSRARRSLDEARRYGGR